MQRVEKKNLEIRERSQIQVAKQRQEIGKNFDEQCKQLIVSIDGIKRSPDQKKSIVIVKEISLAERKKKKPRQLCLKRRFLFKIKKNQ